MPFNESLNELFLNKVGVEQRKCKVPGVLLVFRAWPRV